MEQRKDDIEVLKLLSELAKSTDQEPLQKAVKDVIEEMFGDEVETETEKEKEEKTETKPVEEKAQEEEVKGGKTEEVKTEANPGQKRKAKPSKEELEDEELEAEEEEEPETEEFEEEEEVEEKGTNLTPEEIVIKAVAKIKDEVKELKKSIVDVGGLKDTLDKISGRLDKIEERLTKVEETPVGRKGITKALYWHCKQV